MSGYNEFEFRVDELDLLPNPNPQAHTRFAYGTPQRVEAFLADWLTGLVKVGWDRSVTRKSTDIELMHMFPMSAILHLINQKAGGSINPARKVVFIPGIDNISQDFPRALSEGCGLPASRIPELTPAGQHGSSADPFGTYAAARAVWTAGGPAAKA
eukprot:scaffold322090_cov39-Prasinocladus_malaysianus.AAC.1